MLMDSFKRINSSKTKIDFWDNNSLKVTNFQPTRDKKVNTFYKVIQYKKINIKSPKNYSNITPQNSTVNSNSGNNGSKFLISSKKPFYNSQINFYPKNINQIKNLKEKEKQNEYQRNKELLPLNKTQVNFKRKKLVNIINLSKLSMIYNSFYNLKENKTFLIQKPKTDKISNSDKNNKINYIEKYFAKKYEANQQIKREYQPDLKKFFINKALQQYNKKSGGMMHIKNDINNLYKNSAILNNIIDCISTQLYIIRKKRNKKIKEELNQKNMERHYKKIIKLKIQRGEIYEKNLYVKNKYTTYDEKINQKLKAKLIYKNGYSSNSFKTMRERIIQKINIDQDKKN